MGNFCLKSSNERENIGKGSDNATFVGNHLMEEVDVDPDENKGRIYQKGRYWKKGGDNWSISAKTASR